MQVEVVDEWLKYGDPWSIRRDDLAVEVKFDDYSVKAVPYDMPIIGYDSHNINTLRLFKCEPMTSFDFEAFNNQQYDKAVSLSNRADDISRVLYPNDSTEEGKLLRLRQQYFLVSASLKDIIRSHKLRHDNDFTDFNTWHVIQLNDTHPVLAIPEFIRILVDEEGVSFENALALAKKVFAYTNHTILQEALEKWDVRLIERLFGRILEIIEDIDLYFIGELCQKGYDIKAIRKMRIIEHKTVRMANLALVVGFAVNGVAALHTEILKDKELNDWYRLYPNKFQNKTNGITPRRWLCLANPELAAFITRLLGNDAWVKDLTLLRGLENYLDNEEVLEQFLAIKQTKKNQLAAYIQTHEGVTLDPTSLFDIQIKRLHEYKRQLLNALYVLDLYYQLKENPQKKMPNVTFIFGAKAFPGYVRAKAIVKFVGEIAKLVNNDPVVSEKMKVVFVENYNVSYAERLAPAADISKQISTAGKEASGTGNMKLMLNGAPTFGTYDGANVEIVREAGEENNFIFGLRVEDIDTIGDYYCARDIYNTQPDLKRVVDSLVDGTFHDGGTGEFRELYTSLLDGASWHKADQYFVLADFKAFKETQEKVYAAYQDKKHWAKICLKNIASAGFFSSDSTIMAYANEIWDIQPLDVK
jgi:starch phosphorylase